MVLDVAFDVDKKMKRMAQKPETQHIKLNTNKKIETINKRSSRLLNAVAN